MSKTKAFSAICLHLSRRVIAIDRIGLHCSETRTYCGRNFVDILPAASDIHEDVDGMEKKSVTQPGSPTYDSKKKLKAMPSCRVTGLATETPLHFAYLIELGMDLEQLKGITKRFPFFANYSLEGKIKPTVEMLIGLEMSRSHISYIINKWPKLCGTNITENSIPTIKYLESLGVDKKNWARIICKFPALLVYTQQKVKENVNFLFEMGVSPDKIGNIITKFPNIVGYSVEDKLRPTAEYFRSLGVDVTSLLTRYPNVFGLQIDGNLKPLTNFFLEKEFTIEDVGTMISRFGALCHLSFVHNVIPKWEFFLAMDYSRSELVKYPVYFGLSLEGRIKPRYELLRKSGVKLSLGQLLSPSTEDFVLLLDNKLKKMPAKKDQYITHSSNDLHSES